MTVQRAFAVVAHPDDIEFMMAGTLALLHTAGWEIHYMTVANGCCGSVEYDAATTARIRREESLRAAAVIDAVYHESLCNDLEIFYEINTLRRLASVMRQVAPDIVFTHPPQDYMEDHMNTCRLALTAAFSRGMPNFEVLPQRQPVDKPVTVYHALPYGLRDGLGREAVPEFYVDVGEAMDIKRRMLAQHRSQAAWLDTSQAVNSTIAHMERLTQAMGAMSDVFTFAEGWTRHLPAGFCADDADPLAAALPGRITKHR